MFWNTVIFPARGFLLLTNLSWRPAASLQPGKPRSIRLRVHADATRWMQSSWRAFSYTRFSFRKSRRWLCLLQAFESFVNSVCVNGGLSFLHATRAEMLAEVLPLHVVCVLPACKPGFWWLMWLVACCLFHTCGAVKAHRRDVSCAYSMWTMPRAAKPCGKPGTGQISDRFLWKQMGSFKWRSN